MRNTNQSANQSALKPKEKKGKGRKVPVINFTVHQISDYEVYQNHPEVQYKIFDDAVKAIEDGIKKNKKVVDLCQIDHSESVISFEKNTWKTILNNAMQFFTELEEYSRCILCRDLMSRLK